MMPFDPPWWIHAIVTAFALAFIFAFFMLVAGWDKVDRDDK